MTNTAFSNRVLRDAVLPFSCDVIASSVPGPLLCTTGTPNTFQPPSPRGSAARGAYDTHSAPCSVRSRVSASATPSMVPAGFYTDTCLAPSEESGMRAAHWPHTGRANDRPGDGDRRASELFSRHILQHQLVQAQLCH